MQADTKAALEAAKLRRTQTTTALEALKIRADANAADLVACCDQIGLLEKRRGGWVAAAKPDRVIAAEGELLRAKVGAEIAAARAKKGAEKLSAVTAELSEAEAAVTAAAQAHDDAVSIALALEFVTDLDAALAKGERLKARTNFDPFNMPIGTALVLPPEVVAALERLPRLHPFDTPISQLRGNGAHHNERAQRIAQLMAPDAP